MKADYTQEDIVAALRKAGLCDGDAVFLHSNLAFFGRCDGVQDADGLCRVFFETFQDILGEKGTLVVPTFTYSYCRGEIFDVEHTVSKMGIFPEWVRKNNRALRSRDPNFSVTAVGALAEYLTENCPEHSFGKDSFWERLEQLDGKICCMNFDAGTTFIHYVEKKAGVPYRFDKAFYGTTVSQGRRIESVAYHFCASQKTNEDENEMVRLHQLCIEHGIARIEKLGKGLVLVESTKRLDEFVRNTLKIRPRFLCKREF